MPAGIVHQQEGDQEQADDKAHTARGLWCALRGRDIVIGAMEKRGHEKRHTAADQGGSPVSAPVKALGKTIPYAHEDTEACVPGDRGYGADQ